MHRSTIVLILSLLVPVALPAATIPATDARIEEVTVYRDRAEVVRVASVTVPAGASTIEFTEIPIEVDPDTLRVAAAGVRAALGAVEVRERADEPRETPEWQAARDEVQRLERALVGLREEEVVDGKLLGFLTSLGTVTADRQARALGDGRADVEATRGVYELLETELRELGRAGLERTTRREELKTKLALARAHLGTLRPASAIRSRSAAVELEAAEPGRLTLRLAYLTPRAAWRPTYRATLDAESGRVGLMVQGVVRQSTGEDWSGVVLRLSSASPAQGVEPPSLTPWFLRPLEIARGGFADMEGDPVPDRFYQNVLELAPGVAEQEQPAATIAQSALIRSAYNVSFAVPGRASVPADGTDHRVVLRQESLAANLVHRTVPEVDDRAFLTAVTTAPESYALLAGPVRIFAGGAYLGAYGLSETAPGAELTLPFGVDNRIEVIRVPEPRRERRDGSSGKQRQIQQTGRTLITNRMDRPATLVLEDRVPVPENDRIIVQLGKQTTEGYRDSERRPGVMLWTLQLAPGEKREVVLEYSVRYPNEMVLPGLD